MHWFIMDSQINLEMMIYLVVAWKNEFSDAEKELYKKNNNLMVNLIIHIQAVYGDR